MILVCLTCNMNVILCYTVNVKLLCDFYIYIVSLFGCFRTVTSLIV